MKIVEWKLDGEIISVANSTWEPTPIEDYNIHDIPGWDWSLADLTGVDRTKFDWIQTQLKWNGTTLVKK